MRGTRETTDYDREEWLAITYTTAKRIALLMLCISVALTAGMTVLAVLSGIVNRAVPPAICLLFIAGLFGVCFWHYLSCYRALRAGGVPKGWLFFAVGGLLVAVAALLLLSSCAVFLGACMYGAIGAVLLHFLPCAIGAVVFGLSEIFLLLYSLVGRHL